MNCRANGVVTQNITVSGNYNTVSGVRQVQIFKLSNDCSQDIKNDLDFRTSVEEALKQDAEAMSPGLIGAIGGTNAFVTAQMKKELETFFSDTNISNIISEVDSRQIINVSGSNNVVTNINQEQTAEILQQSLQKSLMELKSIQDLKTKMDQRAKALTKNPISEVIDSVFSGLQGLLKYWALIILGVLFIGVFFFRAQIMAVACTMIPGMSCGGESAENTNAPDPDDG